jgi:HK97 family phage portal protein
MAVVQSLGRLADLQLGWTPALARGSLRLYDRYSYDYAALYRVQPNVRTCVDFLARNIAQLGLHVFERVSETDRRRLRDHPLAQLIERPLPAEFKVTRYRLVESLMGGLGVYFNAFWLKVKGPQTGLLRIPPPYVTVQGGLVPTGYEVSVGGRLLEIAPDEMVHFRGYNAENAILGLSPLETLRRVLAEEHAMGDYREYFWQNAARMGGIIERPAEAPEWSRTARERFKAEFEALYSGAENSGRTAILEEGMTWKENTFNAKDSEYLGGRKLTREECARAYHIPLPMVGILDNATFSNISEQHKNLYQDCLGPWCSMIEQEVQLQLLPDLEPSRGVYCEFNIQEKLKGSFEDQVKALQSAVGRAWMSPDEARARMNLYSMGGDAAMLGTPLNVLVGDQASPRDSAPKVKDRGEKAGRGQIDPTLPGLRVKHERKWAEVLGQYFRRQGAAMASRVPGAASVEQVWTDGRRWDRELGADLFRLNLATALVWARHLAEQIDLALDEGSMHPWLEENARIAADEINQSTRGGVEDALAEEDPLEAVKAMFEAAVTGRAAQIAASRVTTASVFGSQEAATQGGLRTKTWQVNSANPRQEHALMDGETVPIGELFSNGMKWPGDPAGGADNNANCQCSVTFGR